MPTLPPQSPSRQRSSPRIGSDFRPCGGIKRQRLTSEAMICAVCTTNAPGALKRTTDGQWAHLACALWCPGADVGDVMTMSPISLPPRLRSDAEQETIVIECGKDGAAGETIELTASDGRSLNVTIPAATKPRHKVRVEVPPLADSVQAAKRTPRGGSPAPTAGSACCSICGSSEGYLLRCCYRPPPDGAANDDAGVASDDGSGASMSWPA